MENGRVHFGVPVPAGLACGDTGSRPRDVPFAKPPLSFNCIRERSGSLHSLRDLSNLFWSLFTCESPSGAGTALRCPRCVAGRRVGWGVARFPCAPVLTASLEGPRPSWGQTGFVPRGRCISFRPRGTMGCGARALLTAQAQARF